MANSEPETSGRNSPEPAPPKRAETILNGATPKVAARGNDARRSIHLWQKAALKPPTYRYKDIDYDGEIRVLTIYPGKPGSRLECRLSPCPLIGNHQLCEGTEAPLSYTALSYYWGTDGARHKVYLWADDDAHQAFSKNSAKVQDALLNSPLSKVSYHYLQDNLNGALRQLRSEREEVRVWADALCINQNYPEERTAQVSRMHDVYLQAEEVCIWLGSAEGKETENRQTFQFLENILDLKKLEEHITKLQNKEEPERQICMAVIDLMKADWFKRRWVIQELALATRPYVRRGREKMDWTDFGDAIALFMTKHEFIRQAFTDGSQTYEQSRDPDKNLMAALDAKALGANILVTTTGDLFRKSDDGIIQQRLLSLEQLVSSMLLAFEATDPKDTIFAVLKLAKDTFVPEKTDEKLRNWNRMVLIFGIVVFPPIAMSRSMFDTTPEATRPRFSISENSSVGTIEETASPSPLTITTFARWAINWLIWATIWVLIWLISVFILEKVKRALSVFRFFSGYGRKPIDKRVEPDYDKDIIDVYADFIEYCVETSSSLDIICRHWAPTPTKDLHGRKPVMPSWILPLGGHAYGGGPFQSRANGDSLVGGVEGRSHYSASGGLQPKYTFGKNKQAFNVSQKKRTKQASGEFARTKMDHPKEGLALQFDGTLVVKGFALGNIEESSQIVAGVLNQKTLGILGLQSGVPVMDLSGAALDQIWRTLVANRGPGGINPPNWYRRACKACLEWYEKQTVRVFNINTLAKLPGTPRGKVEFLDRVKQVIWERKCFRATMKDGKELVGLAPPNAEVGDMVCIIFGCSVPVVLKKIGKDFKFVGECYVHGMMDGEAVDPIPQHISKQYFRLR